nr:MAG TPA: Recombination enhancement function protein nuclease, DNase, HYDROLASE.4A [Caudoviricetes sp.]
MANSILQTEKECFVCRTTQDLQDHHIFFGTANRKQSEKYGLKVWLCMRHHTGDRGVHFDKGLDRKLKEMAQAKFEETHTREEFIKIFGRNYL